jgi:hypothetical protein
VKDSYFLQVWEPNPFGFIVGMADIIAPDGTFATYITDPGHPDPPFPETPFINLFWGDVKENFFP